MKQVWIDQDQHDAFSDHFGVIGPHVRVANRIYLMLVEKFGPGADIEGMVKQAFDLPEKTNAAQVGDS